jgi:hypothetical protein
VPWGKPEAHRHWKLLKTGVMTAPTPVPSSDPANSTPTEPHSTGLSLRAWSGLILLAFTTVGALALAWLWPDFTRMHFWLVAQALPIFYGLLVCWWAREPVVDSHEH